MGGIPPKGTEGNITEISIIANAGAAERKIEKLLFSVTTHSLHTSWEHPLPPSDQESGRRRHSATSSTSSPRYESALQPPSQPRHKSVLQPLYQPCH